MQVRGRCRRFAGPSCPGDRLRQGQANDQGTTLREAALASGYISAADFDRIVNPAAMAGQ